MRLYPGTMFTEALAINSEYFLIIMYILFDIMYNFIIFVS